MYSKGIVLRKWKNRKMKDTLYYHRITESEKYIISSWKYIGKESVYNRPSYEEDKKQELVLRTMPIIFIRFMKGEI